MNQSTVRLSLQEKCTVLEFDDGRTVALEVGQDDLSTAVFHHDPPTPPELERAIDIIEDALTGSHLAHADRGDLITTSSLLYALPGLGTPGAFLTRNAVESLLERLASRAHGMPVASAELPRGQDIAAALLILRECMHHLGFERVGIA